MVRLRFAVVLSCLIGCVAVNAQAAEIFVEAESFDDRGGWKLDTQFIQQMGSPYLLAHGLGQPVDAASTTIEVAEAGDYHVWVRTIDWVARWKAKPSPGKFQLLVNDKPLDQTFGTQGADWTWHNARDREPERRQNQTRTQRLNGVRWTL